MTIYSFFPFNSKFRRQNNSVFQANFKFRRSNIALFSLYAESPLVPLRGGGGGISRVSIRSPRLPTINPNYPPELITPSKKRDQSDLPPYVCVQLYLGLTRRGIYIDAKNLLTRKTCSLPGPSGILNQILYIGTSNKCSLMIRRNGTRNQARCQPQLCWLFFPTNNGYFLSYICRVFAAAGG